MHVSITVYIYVYTDRHTDTDTQTHAYIPAPRRAPPAPGTRYAPANPASWQAAPQRG